ncbi:MAG: nicotinamide mononucleotide transporter [Clostridia bacterium]|nr:nicotinamide mononucleotide transporter [Clostridia bacterium]
MKTVRFKKDAPLLAGLAATAVGITAAALIFRQPFWQVLPLYAALFVALLQSRMMRAASLVAGANSVLFAIVNYTLRLYANAAYLLFFSCPLQIVTFILWSRRPWGDTTLFRRLKRSWRIALAASSAALALILVRSGGAFALLDSSTTLLGITVTLLTMFAFREYAPLMALQGFLSIALYVFLIIKDPRYTSYLVSQIYSTVCAVFAAVRIGRVCEEQSRAPSARTARRGGRDEPGRGLPKSESRLAKTDRKVRTKR